LRTNRYPIAGRKWTAHFFSRGLKRKEAGGRFCSNIDPMSVTCAAATSLPSTVSRDGYAFVRSEAMREVLSAYGSFDDWHQFVSSWDGLEVDEYMADGGRYRQRRHAVYEAIADRGVQRATHQPHYQPLDYNPLNGGIARWFEPIAPQIGAGATMQTILRFCHAFFGGLAPSTRSWRAEVHQFRIEAREGQVGRPTPEGLHRDGVDYVLVLLIRRRNIARGTTSIHSLDGRRLGDFTLTDPLDAALLDDRQVAHGVTAVQAIDPHEPAYRDVLVVTFAAAPAPA
jgi:hypothetical protein